MKQYIETLKHSPLFSSVSDTEISAMLHCLQAKLLTFQKGEYVFREGEHIDKITVLVEGKLLVQHDDFWGNRNIAASAALRKRTGIQRYLRFIKSPLTTSTL